jgi:starch synthase (maltosyl-transferring)
MARKSSTRNAPKRKTQSRENDAREADAPKTPPKDGTAPKAGAGRAARAGAGVGKDALPEDGRPRAVIDAVRPVVDGGRYPTKRVLEERVDVEADIFTDSHDRVACVVRWRRRGDDDWRETRMRERPNDLWSAHFRASELGMWEFCVQAWVDPFLTWAHDLSRRIDAGQDIETDLGIGAAIVRDTAANAKGDASKRLEAWADRLTGDASQSSRGRAALDDELASLMWEHSPRRHAVSSEPLPLWIDRPLAACSAWYELFPRSTADQPGKHGTLRDVIDRLPYVSEMGFDILYLPPIHPIGKTKRKGPNNAENAAPGDVGSPWAVGGEEGGHKSVHPELGTLDDFDALLRAAKEHGLELAMDIAFQCSPDHPYVREHPEWFRHRPDGSIQYAENPPKKYQDIYPFDFECDDWANLWRELKSVFEFWIDRGVRVFRVDNPHTKPFAFWEWVIGEIREREPGVIFLSEAFTKPKKMYRLAKAGFTQSYTYFAWRNGPWDIRQYVEELSSPPVCDLMRPSFWPNTPDILTDYLRDGGRPAAMARLVLAATLSPSYGIYGPVYELCDFAQRPGSEENLNNEKYQLREWNLEEPWSLRYFIALINRIRSEHSALRQIRNTRFHHCDNPAHVAYSKRSDDGSDLILCVVNTNHSTEQNGIARLDLGAMGVPYDQPYVVHDLLTGVRREWRGADQYIGLGPGGSHVFHIEHAGRTESDFETFV